MYIACPKCNTNFIVLPEEIGNFGRKVKCSKCSHIWHQELAEQQKLEPLTISEDSYSFNEFGKGINLPALLPVKIPGYLFFLPFILTLMIIGLSVVLFQDSFGIKSVISQPKLHIKDINVENHKELGKVIINYKVINFSSGNITMPLVRIRLLDKNSRVVKSYIADQTNVVLSPNQYVNIKTEFASVPQSTKDLDITLGNKLDFILR